MATITIVMHDEDPKRAAVHIVTTSQPAAVGVSVTPAESLAMDLLRLARTRGATIVHGAGHAKLTPPAQELCA